MKAIISTITIVIFLSGSFNSARAQDGNGAIIAAGIGVAVLSGIGFLYSVIYDIGKAPASARKYNESHYGAFPLKSEPTRVADNIFGQPQFSRDALVNNYSPLLSSNYAAKPQGQEKSPQSALYWSLGATLIPVSIGLGGLAIPDSNTKSRIAILGFSSGLIIGPSAGHWYAQQHSRGWKSLALRAGLAALGIASFYLAYAATGSSSS